MQRSRVAFLLRRLSACSLAAAALSALSAGPAAAAPLTESSPLWSPGGGIVDENPEVSAEYSGTMTEIFEYPAIEEHREKVHRTATLEWSEGVSGPADQIEYTGIYGAESLHWRVKTLAGSVTENSTGAGGEPISCAGTFVPKSVDGGEQGVFLPLETPGHPAGGGNPETNADYELRPPLGAPSSLVSSNGTENCQTGYWNSNGNLGWGDAVAFSSDPTVQTDWYDTVAPTVYFPPGGSHTQPLNFSYTCQPPSCGPESNGSDEHFGRVSISVASSITFSSPGLSGEGTPITQKTTPPREELGPPTPFNWLPPDKRAARLDLDPALENAKNYCTPYALGLGGFGTGVLLLASGPIGGMLAVSGSLTASAAAPFCFATLKRVGADIKRYNDPPDPNIYALARPAATKATGLPSCARWRRTKQKAFCKRLRTAEEQWMSAAESAASIEEALVVTTNRESAALAANNRSAIALQSAAGQQLETQLTGALSAKDAAGRKVAAALRGVGIRFRLTRKQSAATIKAVEHGLAKQGISASTLASLGSPVLNPGAVDLLAGLGS